MIAKIVNAVLGMKQIKTKNYEYKFDKHLKKQFANRKFCNNDIND